MTRKQLWTTLAASGLALIAGLTVIFWPRSSTGDIAGRVTYKGKPVTSGAVVLHVADGSAVSAPIAPDGSYHANVKRGAVQLTVVSRDPAMQQLKRTRFGNRMTETASVVGDRKTWMLLPKTVEDPATSGLTTSVVGSVQYDIAIP